MKTKQHQYLRGMVRAYVNCAIWCGHVYESEEDEREGVSAFPMDDYGYSEDDCAFSAWKRAVSDCRNFLEASADISHDWDASQFGHDFYLTRCGHGAGFWDRGKGEVGERLTDLCRPYGSVDLWVDPTDSKLYWI
jgi:hypothetical protein